MKRGLHLTHDARFKYTSFFYPEAIFLKVARAIYEKSEILFVSIWGGNTTENLQFSAPQIFRGLRPRTPVPGAREKDQNKAREQCFALHLDPDSTLGLGPCRAAYIDPTLVSTNARRY